MGWDELRYQPHIARFGGEEIIVVVWDLRWSRARCKQVLVEDVPEVGLWRGVAEPAAVLPVGAGGPGGPASAWAA